MLGYGKLSLLGFEKKTPRSRPRMRGMVELSDPNGKWLGSFLAYGRDLEDLENRAYGEASLNLEAKGYRLEAFRKDYSV